MVEAGLLDDLMSKLRARAFPLAVEIQFGSTPASAACRSRLPRGICENVPSRALVHRRAEWLALRRHAARRLRNRDDGLGKAALWSATPPVLTRPHPPVGLSVDRPSLPTARPDEYEGGSHGLWTYCGLYKAT